MNTKDTNQSLENCKVKQRHTYDGRQNKLMDQEYEVNAQFQRQNL